MSVFKVNKSNQNHQKTKSNFWRVGFFAAVVTIAILAIITIKQLNETQIPFDKEKLYDVLVAVHNDEEKHCGGPCTTSITYVRAMNNKFAVVENKGINKPGGYSIYQKTEKGWAELTGGQEYPSKEWLNKNKIPIEWFY